MLSLGCWMERWGVIASLACATATGVAGCSGDLVGDGDYGDGGTAMTAGAGNAPDDGGTGGGESGDPEPGGDETGGAPTDGADDGGTGAGLGDACDLDCGEGFCELGDDGIPTCACPEGSVLVGLGCLPCTATNGAADLEITSVPFTVRVLIDGVAAPAGEFEDGQLFLRDRVRGDEIALGNSHDTMLSAAALPGTYDVVWQRESGGAVVPMNSGAVLGRVQVRSDGLWLGETGGSALDINGDVLDVDIPTLVASGDFSFNGTAAPDTPLENGRVFLLDPATGDEITLGHTKDGNYSVRVIPGTYEVHYAALVSNGLAPVNHDAYIETIEIENQELAYNSIDIPVTTLTGDFLIDGVAAPPTPFEHGRITLRDVLTGDEIEVGLTSEGDFGLPVVPGSYEVVYSHLLGSAVVPRNSAAQIDLLAIPVGESHAYDVDVTTTSISGTFSVGGQPAPSDSGNVGAITLRSVAGDDEVPLGLTSDGSYSAIVASGSYEVYYHQQASSGAVPINTNARLSEPVVLPDEPLGDIDVPFVLVEGDITVAGEVPPTSEYDDGRIYLRNVQTDDSVLLGNTRLGAIGGLVVPGTYEVVYVVETPGAIVPQNSAAKLDTIVVPDGGAPFDLPIDIPVATLAGKVLVGGAPPPGGDADRANLILQDLATDDLVFLGEVGTGAFSVPLTAGTYVVWYESIASSGTLLPGNVHAGLACFDLVP